MRRRRGRRRGRSWPRRAARGSAWGVAWGGAWGVAWGGAQCTGLTLTPTLTQVREQGLQASIEMQKREAALSLQLEARDTQLEAMQGQAQQAAEAS